jgi:glutathione S-transferase
MSETITFYHNPMSRGRIVHWMLEEVGAPYETKILEWEKREHKSPEYLAINPMGKIPTIVHRGVVITEVAAILTYLADAFPAAGLAPAIDDPKRGTYLRWLFFAAGCLEPAMTDKSQGRVSEKPGQVGYGTYEDTMNAVHTAITPGPFILGDKFSTADLYLSSMLGYGMFTKTIEPTSEIGAYVARCNERPVMQRLMATR